MPLTSYCKKCGQDIPVSSFCPNCRSKLAPSTVRLAWCVEHHPVRDWMCWNSVMRLLLPVLGATILLLLLLEGLMGGLAGVMSLLGGGLIVTLLYITCLLLSAMLGVFILQGEDLLDCVIDARGIHVQVYLSHPTALRLLLRGKSPRLLAQMGDDALLLLSSREIAWKDIQRVQLWPEKTMVLFYAPRWWMRVALPCSPFAWQDALDFIRDKIGKKKAVILPEECRQSTPGKAAPARGSKARQLSFDDVAEDVLPAMPIPEEEVLPGSAPEAEGDFTPLTDVLQEIKEANQS